MCLTPAARERTHRRVDEAVTAGVEVFLAEREGLEQVFTTAELVRAISIARFTERDAQLFLVALMGQGRAHHDRAGWYPGPSTPV